MEAARHALGHGAGATTNYSAARNSESRLGVAVQDGRAHQDQAPLHEEPLHILQVLLGPHDGPTGLRSIRRAISEAGTDLTNSDGEPTVMVVGNELERTTIGTRTGTTTTTAEDNATTKADSVGKLTGRKRARASDAGGDDDDDDDNAMTTPNPKRKGDPSQRLTAAALSKLGAQKGPAGAKAPFVLLTKRFASADKDQVALLDTDPQATLNRMKAEVVDPLRELQREVEKLHVGQVGAKQVFLWTSSFRLSPLHSPTIWFWGTCLGVRLP